VKGGQRISRDLWVHQQQGGEKPGKPASADKGGKQ